MSVSNKVFADVSPLRPAEIVDQCLTREEKEKIVVLEEQNAFCHKSLAKASEPPAIDKSWPIILLAIFGGIASGMVLEGQVRR